MPPGAGVVVGSVFAGAYRVMRPLSHGGMGSVYVAEQLATGAPRALKLLHPELCADARIQRLFEQEARIGHQIQSDHIVHVIDAGIDTESQIPWIAMELLEGEDLGARIKRLGALPWTDADEILGQIGHALAAAHAIGVVHRDLKPENVFLTVARREGAPLFAKLLDFGIAKVVAEARRPGAAAGAPLETAMARSIEDMPTEDARQGTMVGTPMWMAPEQITGAAVSPATDVWALGLLAFWVLTGHVYWTKADGVVRNVFAEVIGGSFAPASARAAEIGRASLLPLGFDAWFARCVAAEPAYRFPHAGAAREALRAIFAGPDAVRPRLTRTSTLPPSQPPTGPQPPGAAYDPAWYVAREREEREALNALAFAGQPAVLWGPSRFGKTWLLDHCLERVRERDGFTTVVVDMRLLQRGSMEDLLRSLADRIAEERDEPPDSVEDSWRRPGTAVSKMTRLLERQILPRVPRGLVLAIDGVDELWQSPLQDDFCGLLRAWAESCHAPWPRLRLMLAISTTPSLLISDPNRSPFNLSAPIVLGDLGAAHVAELAGRYGLPWSGPDIDQVMQLVGGHPYYVRLLMHRASLHMTPLPELLDASLGARWILHEDVQRLRRRLARGGLLPIAERVAQDPAIKLDSVDLQRVTRAGLVVEEADGRLRIRNRLYTIAITGRP